MIDLMSLRGLLFIEAMAVLLLCFSLAGSVWFHRHWPARVTYVGLLILASYVAAIQVKAYQRESPFDAYSQIGMVGATVTIIGLVWLIGRLHTSGRG